jgi:hypothetical protein
MLKKILAATVVVIMTAAFAGAANAELKLSPPLKATLAEVTCLHETPGKDAPTVMCFSNTGVEMNLVARLTDKETVDGKSGYWYKAEVGDSMVGWIFSSYLTIAKAAGDCPGKCDSCGKK